MAVDNEFLLARLYVESPGYILATTPGLHSAGITRVLNGAAGTPGEERLYQEGDEALVEQGYAEWVVAPVFTPEAGRRLDGAFSAEKTATPSGGVEAFPPAISYVPGREAKARADGYVEAFTTDEPVEAKLAVSRSKAAKDAAGGDDKASLATASLGARSGPVTAHSELPADVQAAQAADATNTAQDADTDDPGGTRVKGRVTKTDSK